MTFNFKAAFIRNWNNEICLCIFFYLFLLGPKFIETNESSSHYVSKIRYDYNRLLWMADCCIGDEERRPEKDLKFIRCPPTRNGHVIGSYDLAQWLMWPLSFPEPWEGVTSLITFLINHQSCVLCFIRLGHCFIGWASDERNGLALDSVLIKTMYC